jgi:dTDP-4-dehydrorhamnose 3,5-epimerase
MIDGVIITPLEQIFDERGKVMHMMRKDSEIFSSFGEIYFSCTYPGAIKAWHLHTEMTLNYAVISGSIKCVLYDDRPDSKTRGRVDEYFLSPENYSLITVPPLIWNGWKGIGDETSIVANCATIPHDPNEIKRKTVSDPSIPYNWEIKHK